MPAQAHAHTVFWALFAADLCLSDVIMHAVKWNAVFRTANRSYDLYHQKRSDLYHQKRSNFSSIKWPQSPDALFCHCDECVCLLGVWVGGVCMKRGRKLSWTDLSDKWASQVSLRVMAVVHQPSAKKNKNYTFLCLAVVRCSRFTIQRHLPLIRAAQARWRTCSQHSNTTHVHAQPTWPELCTRQNKTGSD